MTQTENPLWLHPCVKTNSRQAAYEVSHAW